MALGGALGSAIVGALLGDQLWFDSAVVAAAEY
jgi:hypothetical protein